MLKRLGGVFPPIPTPFDANGAVDTDALRANIALWNQQPLAGLVVGGSNGEFPLLSDDERILVVRAAAEEIPAGRMLIAGAGAESTAATIRLCQAMADAGAEAALVVTPHYYKALMTGDALADHYRRVADDSPIPVLLYNVPANTGLDISVEAALSLLPHENIIGMKDSSGNMVRIGRLAAASPAKFVVLAGSGGFFLPALSVGAVGCVAALANIAAKALADIQSAFDAGDQASASERQAALMPLNHAVTAGGGVPALKAALDLMGGYGGPVRSPLQPLPEAEKRKLERLIEAAGLSPLS